MVNPFADLRGQRILVTGASSGIGRAACILLSQLGSKLVLVGRSQERLAETLRALEGTEHSVETRDLSQAPEIPGWMKQIAQNLGPLNGVVHCAGVHSVSPVRFLKDAEFNRVMNLNVNSGVQLAKGFRQKGVLGEAGSLVLLSSVIGLVGQAGVAAYSASKGAVCALTRSLAMELAPEGIRVNCISPGVVKTEMTQGYQEMVSPDQFDTITAMHPLGLGEPLDVGYAIAFLLSKTGRWITGTTLVVDGGFTAH